MFNLNLTNLILNLNNYICREAIRQSQKLFAPWPQWLTLAHPPAHYRRSVCRPPTAPAPAKSGRSSAAHHLFGTPAGYSQRFQRRFEQLS